MSSEWDPANVFDVFGDESARRILALAAERSRSAEELADNLAIAQPTVYRRLDVLEARDLVRTDRRIDDDGHHYEVYETTLESATFELVDGEVVVDLTLTRDPGAAVDDFAE